MVEGEGACCFRGGDQAVDGLGFSSEGIGGGAAPRGGECDGAGGVGVGAVKARAPAIGRRVVVADQPGVLVGVHALLEDHPLVGGDGVRGAIAPVPFVVRGFQGDGDVVSEQMDRVGLGRMGGRHEILRMLRNYHAHPPTRIPVTARMCATQPRPRREMWERECSRNVRDRRC